MELNYLLNFLVQFAFPIIQDSLGWGKTFGIFAIVLFAAFVFIKHFVPETTGLTLEEIQVQLLSNKQFHEEDYEGDSDTLSERSPLLPGQATVLRAVPSYEELESQLIRTISDAALDDVKNKPTI